MNKLFYPKLALSNIKKNGKLYFPYLLTCVFTISFYYIMSFLTNNKGLDSMPGAESLKMLMFIGSRVIAIFSAIFLFYTNSFLMKQRKKEMGLYNILGMEKRHIGRIMLFEIIFCSFGSILAGLIVGILISKLSLMCLCRMLSFPNPIGFKISSQSLVNTMLLFAVIFFVTLLSNLISIGRSKPIELLNATHAGEKEPKTKWIIALIGLLTLGGGYYFALTTKSAIQALSMFFLAVVLVIVGTYCLFTAGSIALLKTLRKNKHYYYQAKHFTSISGMLYRMKQNAVGLANICILCTMVLITISTTVCLYLGCENSLENRYPYDINISNSCASEGYDRNQILNNALELTKQYNLDVKVTKDYEYLSIVANNQNNTFVISNDYSLSNNCYMNIIAYDDYINMGGDKTELKDNEFMYYSENSYKLPTTFTMNDTVFNEKKHLKAFPLKSDSEGLGMNVLYIIVNSNTFNSLNNFTADENAASAPNKYYELYMDLNGTKDNKIAYSNATYDFAESCWCKQEMKDEFYTIYGGFLFLGIFLGVLFLMATVLIIYYKQISEGYDDRERFIIMQKVGMSKKEIKQSIKSQVLTVFLLPIIVAAIHILASFRIIKQLLSMFGLTNTTLFVECTSITLLIFLVIYIIVYRLTSKIYYKIVQ